MGATVAVLLLSSLAFTSIAKATQEDDAVSEYLTYEDSKFFVSGNVTRRDNTFLLASCDKDKFPQEINCNITIMRLPYDTGISNNSTILSQGATLYRNCNLTSTLVNNRTLMVKQFPLELDFLGVTSKALITWNELSSDYQAMYKKIAILDFSSCRAQYLDLSYFKRHPVQHVLITNVVIHRNTFDVFISDEVACGGLKKCRLTYNQWGVVEGHPIPFTTKLFIGKTIMAPAITSSHPGFYIFAAFHSEPHTAMVEQIGEYGDVKRRLKTNVKHDSKISHLITSTANSQFTICGRMSKQTICDQFDVGITTPKLNYLYEHRLKDEVTIGVHNLANGGFLFVTIGCDNFKELSCNDFNVIKALTDGTTKVLSKVSIKLKCNDDLNHLSIDTIEDNGIVCFHLLCMKTQNEDGRTMSIPSSLLQCISGFQII